MSLDYHFKVEQEVGSSTYAFFGFNGNLISYLNKFHPFSISKIIVEVVHTTSYEYFVLTKSTKFETQINILSL
jgi:hypothetical protein